MNFMHAIRAEKFCSILAQLDKYLSRTYICVNIYAVFRWVWQKCTRIHNVYDDPLYLENMSEWVRVGGVELCRVNINLHKFHLWERIFIIKCHHNSYRACWKCLLWHWKSFILSGMKRRHFFRDFFPCI